MNKEKLSPRPRKLMFAAIALIAILVIAAFFNQRLFFRALRYAPTAARGVLPGGIERVAIEDKIAAKIVQSAHEQIGTRYDARYVVISYPNGDVDTDRGACTDVVIRALRSAGYDLQQLIHDDMTKNFRLYPHQWGLDQPDKNIDHRRVPNQMKYFARFGQTLTTRVDASTLKTWLPGDIVCWDMGNGKTHTGIVSDGVNRNGVPLVIHNGWICGEDDSLTRWKIIGHFRYPKRAAPKHAAPQPNLA